MKKIIRNVTALLTFLPLIVLSVVAVLYTIVMLLTLNMIEMIIRLDPVIKAQVCLWPFRHIHTASTWLISQWDRVLF